MLPAAPQPQLIPHPVHGAPFKALSYTIRPLTWEQVQSGEGRRPRQVRGFIQRWWGLEG